MEQALTKEIIDRLMVSIAASPQPTRMIVPRSNAAVLAIFIRGSDEGWDRRRIKREARKGLRSRYRGGPFSGSFTEAPASSEPAQPNG